MAKLISIFIFLIHVNISFGQLVPLLRYNNGVDHMYQTDPYYLGGPEAFGYWYEGYEGFVFLTQQPGTVPLYRYYNGVDHVYQLDPKKFGGPEAFGYWYEGICCYVYAQGGTARAPLYRYANGVDHLYQICPTRYGGPEAFGYWYEGIEGYVVAIDACGVSHSARLSAATAKDKVTTSDVKVFPNPTSGNVTIETIDFEPIKYSVFNSLSQIIQEGALNGRELQLKDLPAGTYQVAFFDGKQQIQKRIVKL
jgi:hypothetical protein